MIKKICYGKDGLFSWYVIAEFYSGYRMIVQSNFIFFFRAKKYGESYKRMMNQRLHNDTMITL